MLKTEMYKYHEKMKCFTEGWKFDLPKPGELWKIIVCDFQEDLRIP